MNLALHHVSVIGRDIDRSIAFYEGVLGFKRIARPPFTTPGLWFELGALQVHVVIYPEGSFRTRGVDGNDVHFALHTSDFDAALAALEAKGFSADLADDHPQKLIVKKTGLAGFPQLYLCDPDQNIIEINQAPL